MINFYHCWSIRNKIFQTIVLWFDFYCSQYILYINHNAHGTTFSNIINGASIWFENEITLGRYNYCLYFFLLQKINNCTTQTYSSYKI